VFGLPLVSHRPFHSIPETPEPRTPTAPESKTAAATKSSIVNTKTKFVGTSKTNIVTSTQFALKTAPELPERGFQKAIIEKVAKETGIEKDVDINRIRITLLLDAKDSNGKNYVIEKLYNMGANGRGTSTILKDYLDWSGIEIADEDVYGFDCNAAMKGHAVIVNVGYHVTGAKVTPYIKSFHPEDYNVMID
jgi:hypothetical protein